MAIPLIKGKRKTKYDYRDNLPVNITAVVENIEGDQGYLIAHDGLSDFATTSGTARGGYFNERLNRHFRVSGQKFESVDSDGSITIIGDISGNGVCSFSESFNTQAIVADGKFYLYNGVTFTQVGDPDLGSPLDITWFRGIYVMTDGQFLFHTDINNEYSISPLKYSSSEFATDPIKAVLRTDGNQIVALNRYSTEWFYFNAAAPTGTSVLAPIQGKSSRVGVIGTHCKVFLDGNIFILGGRKEESPSIHILNGATESTVATREVDKIISTYTETELSDAYMESRTVDRDKFIIIHLPSHTLLYNHTVAMSQGPSAAWSFIKSDDDSKWRGIYGVFDPRVSKWVYGDSKNNKLGYLNSEIFSQYKAKQELLFYTPIIPAKQISISEISLDTIPGFSSDDVSCAVSISFDGVVWGQEYWLSVSKPSDYNINFILRRLGYVSRSFSLRFRVISNDKMAFSGLEVNAG